MVTKEHQRLFFVLGAERNLKSLLYSEFVSGKRNRGRLTLRFKDVCKRNLKNFNISSNEREEFANIHEIYFHKKKDLRNGKHNTVRN